MVVTSLKEMPEIRLGYFFGLPQKLTFQPWIDAWAHACTGRDCFGLRPGFLNSVKIAVPSVIISIIVGSINGYALTFWRYKGANAPLHASCFSAPSCPIRSSSIR